MVLPCGRGLEDWSLERQDSHQHGCRTGEPGCCDGLCAGGLEPGLRWVRRSSIEGVVGRMLVRCHARVIAPVGAVLSLLALAPAGCGDSPHVSTGGGAACASVSPSRYFASARVVFVGTMLPGPAVTIGDQKVLTSPARMRVSRYLKGGGPVIVRVVTSVSNDGGAVGAEGIEPVAGQRWKIYTDSRRMPYATSICDGSSPVGGQA